MARLLIPGGDNDQWGGILDSFLSVEHNANGSLKKAAQIANKYDKPASGIPEIDLVAAVRTKLNSVGSRDAADRDRPSTGIYIPVVTDTGMGVIRYDADTPGTYVWMSGGSISSGLGFTTISALYERLI